MAWFVYSVLVLGCVTPLPADNDAMMGIWEGSYAADGGDTGELVLKVVALGGGEYLAVAEIGQSETRAEIPGQLEGETAVFKGTIDLGPTYGGSYQVRAVAAGSELKGEFSGVDAFGTFGLRKAVRESPTLGAKPPEGAVVLFDGSGLGNWQHLDGSAPTWKVLPTGAMEVVKGNIVSKPAFGDVQLHLEFRTPFMPEARGQARGNSGVYLEGRYEAQILDSFGLEPKHNECGGIYEIAAPRVNACLPPLDWQTYDIEFRAPRFDASGNKVADAVMTVHLNGVLIHDRVNVPRPTRASMASDELNEAGLMLQDHGNPVQYRNIWLKPLIR